MKRTLRENRTGYYGKSRKVNEHIEATSVGVNGNMKSRRTEAEKWSHTLATEMFE